MRKEQIQFLLKKCFLFLSVSWTICTLKWETRKIKSEHFHKYYFTFFIPGFGKQRLEHPKFKTPIIHLQLNKSLSQYKM
jgi:hypothetical protein